MDAKELAEQAKRTWDRQDAEAAERYLEAISKTIYAEGAPLGPRKTSRIWIDDPEFLQDMAMTGREIMRCFGRASNTADFRGSVISELDEYHDHLLAVNQIAEAILVEAAAELLRAGGDPVKQTAANASSKNADVPLVVKAQYADLPQSFFGKKT